MTLHLDLDPAIAAALERLAAEQGKTAEEIARGALSALLGARPAGDAAAYAANPPLADEFSDEHDPLAWEGAGWDEFYAAR